jgi:bifunctional non-homologous end joining protein LigD
MLSVPWPAAFDDPAWWFEVKWDGVRVLVEAEPGRVRLRSRSGRDMSATYPELTGLVVDRPTVLDGEIIAFDSGGVPSFGMLQTRMNATRPVAATPVSLVVFDLLHHGEPTVGLPIEDRWKRLASLDLPGVVRSEPVQENGMALFEAAKGLGIEGIVAKRVASTYQPGRRSPDWRKVPIRRRTKALVGGFTPGEGGRSSSFGALQLGLWHEGRLRYVGGVGTGFDDVSLVRIRQALDQLGGEPLAVTGDWPPGTRFVLPVLVAVVEYLNWTSAGRLRGPAFVGFGDDDPAVITWRSEGPGDIGEPTG